MVPHPITPFEVFPQITETITEGSFYQKVINHDKVNTDMAADLISTFFAVFIPLFIIVNPSSTLALFSVITAKSSKQDRIRTARNAALYAAILLIIFAVARSSILAYLNIEVYALRIAGGLLLGFVGLDMLRRGEQFGESPPDKKLLPNLGKFRG